MAPLKRTSGSLSRSALCSNPLAESKRHLREAARRERALAHEARSGTEGDLLAGHGLDLLGGRSPGTVSGYAPIDTEIDCLPLLGALEQAGWQVALPVVVARGQPLEFRRWQVGTPLAKGAWGIGVPEAGSTAVAPDVLLVPLLGFDREGHRLGYGGGFYDRSLAQLRAIKVVSAIGVAYAAQNLGRCPHEAFDQTLDAVLTERGPIIMSAAVGQG